MPAGGGYWFRDRRWVWLYLEGRTDRSSTLGSDAHRTWRLARPTNPDHYWSRAFVPPEPIQCVPKPRDRRPV